MSAEEETGRDGKRRERERMKKSREKACLAVLQSLGHAR